MRPGLTSSGALGRVRDPAAGQLLLAAGRSFSWLVLLGIPLFSIAVAVVGLTGAIDLDAMWIALAAILAIVFLHGARHVRWEEAGP